MPHKIPISSRTHQGLVLQMRAGVARSGEVQVAEGLEWGVLAPEGQVVVGPESLSTDWA